MFIARLNGAPIGLSVWNMFVIDLPAILTVSLMIQFVAAAGNATKLMTMTSMMTIAMMI